MSSWNQSFDTNWLTWLVPTVPWIFLIQKTRSGYEKFGAIKLSKIAFHLMAMGLGSVGMGFGMLFVYGVISKSLSGEFFTFMQSTTFPPMLVLGAVLGYLAFWLGGGAFIFKMSFRDYKKLIHCNPLGI